MADTENHTFAVSTGYSNFQIKSIETSLKCILIVTIIFAATLSGCAPSASANKYNLTETINAGKFPSSEMDNIAYKLREAIEQNHRMDTEWLSYWVNAEMIGRCGTIKVNDLQEGKTDVPLKPIDLKELISIETWIEYESFTESQMINKQNTAAVAKTVKGLVVYKDGRWEVKSAEEMKDSLGAYCP
ncbi:MAG: hypothetical protein JW908_06055 [Anaerolineales bacterium]|nr:hypothetical protein [Anaerolineales bacterium]